MVGIRLQAEHFGAVVRTFDIYVPSFVIITVDACKCTLSPLGLSDRGPCLRATG